MRNLTLATAAALALGGAAVAGDLGYDPALDEVLNLGSVSFTEGAPVIDAIVPVEENGNPVVGFSFSGDVTGISGTGTWASDTRLDITSPDGQTTSFGGFGGGAGDNPWDFDGPDSTDDGSYASGPHLVFDAAPKGGDWTFTFTQTFFSGPDQVVNWDNVQITLHKIPAPGALALLGLAGVAGGRRRRA